MNIGLKIKELRKQRGLTQEQLAESIGVTFQAVSKWENGIALPDISLVPQLAAYFCVSMDTMFDFSLKEMEKDIDEITWESYKYRETDPEKGRQILEEGLKKYPDNCLLLNNMLYVINYSENPDETIRIASKLIEMTNEKDIEYDALRFLAYAYKAKGDLTSAESAINRIPEIYFTALTEKAFLLEGDAKEEAAEKQKWISFEQLLQMMQKLAECCEAKGETDRAIEETEKALRLLEALPHKNFGCYVEFFTKQLERMTRL